MLQKTSLLICFLLAATSTFAQETYVFFGSYNWDKTSEGIYVYKLNTKNGKLSKVTSVRDVHNPSYLTLSPDGKYIFACTESKTKNGGSVSSFEFNPKNNSLTFINSQKSGGENPVYLTVHQNKKWLINGNYTESSVSVYPIAENGVISPFVQNIHFTEGSINPTRQEKSHVHSTVFSPDFKYLFLPDLGSDKIRSFEFKGNESEPLKIAEQSYTQTTLGAGPRHFTFHPNGNFAYSIEELSGTVNAYKYSNGKLNSIQRVNTHSEKYKDGFESSDVHISPDGNFLYASNRGKENNIAIFSISEDGTLKSIGYKSTFGKHPRVFAIDETGRFLIATNVNTGNVVVFKRDLETGRLKKVHNKARIKNVTCVRIKEYSNPA